MAEPDPEAADYARDLFAASAKYAAISWSESGAEPRWLGMDTSTCPVAINPSHFHNRGADEFERFLTGAASRGEPALIIATMGNADDDGLRSVFGPYTAGIHFRGFTGSIGGKRLPAGADIRLAPDPDAADRDLGLRLLNRPANAPWWAMALQPIAFEGPQGTTVHEPEGELVPILVDNLGEPVVARWTPSDRQEIWYVIPDAVDWDTVVDWIVQKALPEHVPAALRRVRSAHSIDANLENPQRRKPAQLSMSWRAATSTTRPASRLISRGRGRKPSPCGQVCCTALAVNWKARSRSCCAPPASPSPIWTPNWALDRLTCSLYWNRRRA
jgi:hypothetical protein